MSCRREGCDSSTRPLRLYGTKELPERTEELRNPTAWTSTAYQWNGSQYEQKVQEYK